MNQAGLREAYGSDEQVVLKVAFERSVALLRHGVVPVFVLEGTSPAQKQELQKRRRGPPRCGAPWLPRRPAAPERLPSCGFFASLAKSRRPPDWLAPPHRRQLMHHGQVLSSQGNRAGSFFDRLGQRVAELAAAMGLAAVRAEVRPGLGHPAAPLPGAPVAAAALCGLEARRSLSTNPICRRRRRRRRARPRRCARRSTRRGWWAAC
jgi:hypothetical protein